MVTEPPLSTEQVIMNSDTSLQSVLTAPAHPPETLAKGCPLERLGRLLRGTWTLQVLWVLGEGTPLRFGDLRTVIEGISAKVLTERLRVMEHAGLIWRCHEEGVPPKVTYGLTEVGTELHDGLKRLGRITDKLPPE